MKTARSCSTRPGARIKGVMAVLIIGGALLRVTQGFVGFAKFLKFFFGRFIPRIFIGVEFDCELTVGLFNFVRIGFARHAEDFVIIAFGHGN